MKLCELRKNPYTVSELYKIVEEKLKKDGNWPEDMIDYVAVDNTSLEILDNTFDVVPQVQYGASEGIYLEVYFIGAAFTHDKVEKLRICTVKTLNTSRDAMRRMAVLGADIEVDLSEFLNRNSFDFDWKYYSVRIIKEDGTVGYGYSCPSLSVAEQKFDKLVQNGEQHVVMLDKTTKLLLQEHKKGE